MILVVIIGLVSACVVFWGIYLHQKTYYTVKETLPPEFQDDEFGYAAYPEFALSRSTPLAVQADYLKGGVSISAACFGFSICAFLLGKTFGASLFLAFFFASAIVSIRDVKTYRENRDRRMRGHDKEEL